MAISLEKAFKKARKAWRADKTDKALKKAFKAAKAAFEASKEGDAAPVAEKTAGKKRKAETEEESPAKKAKPSSDLPALKKALKAARKAKKADNTKETRIALKKAKAAVEEAEKATAEPAAEEATEEATEEAAEEATEEAAEEATEEAPADEGLAGLKSNKKFSAALADIDMSKQCERLFCGNLSWDIDDDAIKEFFKDAGTINDVYWLEDRDTGKFKGCGFVTFDSVDQATAALELNGTEVMGRPIKLDFSPRNNRGSKGSKGGKGKGGKGKGGGTRELSEKPEDCTTVFCGNLSFDIDDDAMKKFASDAGCGEVKAIRWLSDRDTGDFKGCGFVEFWDTKDVDSLVKKNGEELLGRNVRLDYGGARKPRENKW